MKQLLRAAVSRQTYALQVMQVLECFLLCFVWKDLPVTSLTGSLYRPAVAQSSSRKVFTAGDITILSMFEVLLFSHALVHVKDCMKTGTLNSLWNYNTTTTIGLAVQMATRSGCALSYGWSGHLGNSGITLHLI